MLPTLYFPDSLHHISIWRAFEASVGRNPNKVAISSPNLLLTYGEIDQLTRQPFLSDLLDHHTLEVLQFLRLLCSAYHNNQIIDENAILYDQSKCLTERSLGLSILNIAVCHPILSRDTVSAVPVNLEKPMNMIVSIAPLFLGGTVCFVDGTNISTMIAKISEGSVNQAWLGEHEYNQWPPKKIPDPSPQFRGLICIGLPRSIICNQLIEWAGPEKVQAVALDQDSLPWARYLNMSPKYDPYPGFILVDEKIPHES